MKWRLGEVGKCLLGVGRCQKWHLVLSLTFRVRRWVLNGVGISKGRAWMWCTRRQLFSQKDDGKLK